MAAGGEGFVVGGNLPFVPMSVVFGEGGTVDDPQDLSAPAHGDQLDVVGWMRRRRE